MTDNPLKMVPENPNNGVKGWVSSKGSLRESAAAKFNRLWTDYPEQFSAKRDAAQVERVERTLYLIQKHLSLKDITAADLGCGSGTLSRRLRDLGSNVDAVDISEVALNDFKKHDMQRIHTFHDYIPRTTLKDDHYDLVLATEIIAYLPKEEMRLFMAELARLVKSDGSVVVSTNIDINSTDALLLFSQLTETEFHVDEWAYGYHKYWIRLLDFFAAPARFVQASNEKTYLEMKLDERKGFSHFWFSLNAKKPLSYFWKIISLISRPIANFIKNNLNLLRFLEKICRTLSPINGISHATWIGKRRPIIEEIPKVLPEERKGKKQVWE